MAQVGSRSQRNRSANIRASTRSWVFFAALIAFSLNGLATFKSRACGTSRS
jgi:hypothetical protein